MKLFKSYLATQFCLLILLAPGNSCGILIVEDISANTDVEVRANNQDWGDFLETDRCLVKVYDLSTLFSSIIENIASKRPVFVEIFCSYVAYYAQNYI